jgi:hypothetical protein
VHDDFDDLFLEAAGQLAGELLEAPVADLPERLQAIVRHTLLTGRPDGTWPPTELLGEMLASYLDAFDERLLSIWCEVSPTSSRGSRPNGWCCAA